MKVEVKKIRSLLELGSAILEEGRIEFGEDGASIRGIDPTQITAVEAKLAKREFSEYKPQGWIGLKLRDATKFLKKIDGEVDIAVKDNTIIVKGRNENRKFRFSLRSLDIESFNKDFSGFCFDVKVRVKTKELMDSVNCAFVADYRIKLKVEDSVLKVYNEGVEIVHERVGTGKGNLTVNGKFLIDILKVCGDEVEIMFSTGKPLCIKTYKDGCEALFLIAPIIEN